MTIVLMGFGTALFGGAMYLLSHIPPEGGKYNGWWLFGAFICIGFFILAYGIALYREWKREKLADKERRDREQREIERHEEWKKTLTHVHIINSKPELDQKAELTR